MCASGDKRIASKKKQHSYYARIAIQEKHASRSCDVVRYIYIYIYMYFSCCCLLLLEFV